MTTEPNPFAALLSGVKAQLHDDDPDVFHGDSGPGNCPRCAGPVPTPPTTPEPSTCTCAGTRAGLNACVHCPTPWPDFPGAIRMTRPEDVAAALAPAFARSAPSCIWPGCLTPEQQAQLADQVGAAMGGEATTPMPDQRVVCGCREPAPDLGPAELTAEEARALAEELGQDLYEAQDALSFVAECCDVADRTGEPVTTARVRTWLEGAKCGRQIMAERGRSIVDVPAPSDIGTEFVRQADNPDWDALAKATAQASIDTPGCDCGHDGMGAKWHASDCEWLSVSPCDACGERGHSFENCPQADAPTELGTPAASPNETGGDVATATLTVTVHAPDDANATRWATSIGQLVNAEFGDSMRLTTSVTAGAPAFTWAESVATSGIGPTAQIDIDIHAPGQAEPVPVEMPLDVARTLHAMLGGLLGEHDEAEPDGPTNEDLRLRVFGIALDNLIRFKGSSLHPSTVAVDISDAVLAVRDGEMDRLRADVQQIAADAATIRRRQWDECRALHAQISTRAEEAEARLAAVEQEIRSLHCREKDGTCGACIEFSNERHTTYETWPCSTIRELDDALAAPTMKDETR